MIVVAIPTIQERGDAWKDVAAAWYERTPADHEVVCVPSWRPSSWCDGLNEVWETHGHLADVFCAASDDMVPQEGWLPAITPYLWKGIIAPQVHDPRFSRFDARVKDGDETRMSTFPIISQRFLSQVFPLPSGLHYYGDDLISDKAKEAGIPTIAVPSCVIDHLFDERGRGAGMGDESTRMAYDRQIYKALRKQSSV